jgi:uncharacterized OB-fold protein
MTETASPPAESRVLSAPLRVAFDYTRSTGPVLGAFMTGLRERRILGGRTSDGRVIVPPAEFDPVTHEATTEFVEVASTGTVATWTWVSEPVPGQPLQDPFAFALITLDGASAPMLHAVKAPGPHSLSTGMKVQAVWSDTPVGHITDIQYFEPTDRGAEGGGRGGHAGRTDGAAAGSEAGDEAPASVDGPGPLATKEPGWLDGGASAAASKGEAPSGDGGPVTGIITPVELDYIYEASPEESSFFRAIAEGRLVGQRCPKCEKVYIPPRGACPVDGVPTAEEVELPDTGIVTTFCIVNVPFLGQKIKPPYVSAYILLEGADIAFLHLILGVPAEEVRMGMKVRAVWKPREEWGTTVENISHFEPTGEPDAGFESYRAHL